MFWESANRVDCQPNHTSSPPLQLEQMAFCGYIASPLQRSLGQSVFSHTILLRAGIDRATLVVGLVTRKCAKKMNQALSVDSQIHSTVQSMFRSFFGTRYSSTYLYLYTCIKESSGWWTKTAHCCERALHTDVAIHCAEEKRQQTRPEPESKRRMCLSMVSTD
jgi:hypothetical protein